MTPNQKGMVFTKTQKAQHEVIPVAAPLYVQRVPPPVSAFNLIFFFAKTLYMVYLQPMSAGGHHSSFPLNHDLHLHLHLHKFAFA